jgi:hypothetical protein
MTKRRPTELLYSLVAVIFITLVYLGMNVILGETPPASSFYGHSMGVIGFLLMVMTETLYSLRKRSRLARWGQMSSWLRFHIFTGIVGPYLVLLHSSWKFNGVAGVLTLMTAVIVISGFIGRYIYTSVPRTADGLVLEADMLERQILAIDNKVQAWIADQKTVPQAFITRLDRPAAAADNPVGLVMGRGVLDMQQRFTGWQAAQKLDASQRKEARELESLLRRRDALRRQAGSLQAARVLLATWHAIHIPIGLALFSLALVHIAAAIYYALMLK